MPMCRDRGHRTALSSGARGLAHARRGPAGREAGGAVPLLHSLGGPGALFLLVHRYGARGAGDAASPSAGTPYREGPGALGHPSLPPPPPPPAYRVWGLGPGHAATRRLCRRVDPWGGSRCTGDSWGWGGVGRGNARPLLFLPWAHGGCSRLRPAFPGPEPAAPNRASLIPHRMWGEAGAAAVAAFPLPVLSTSQWRQPHIW